MRRVLERVETDAADPIRYEPGVLTRSEMLIGAAATRKQVLPRFAVTDPEVVVQRLSRDLCQFEPDWPARLSLPDVGAIDCVAVGCHVIDAQRDEIAAPQLAVDGEVEQGQVAPSPVQLQLRADQPHVPWPQRRLRARELALVPSRPIESFI